MTNSSKSWCECEQVPTFINNQTNRIKMEPNIPHQKKPEPEESFPSECQWEQTKSRFNAPKPIMCRFYWMKFSTTTANIMCYIYLIVNVRINALAKISLRTTSLPFYWCDFIICFVNLFLFAWRFFRKNLCYSKHHHRPHSLSKTCSGMQ